MGVAFVVLALGNAWTTGTVLVSKSKNRHLIQMVKERVTGKSDSASAGAGNKAALNNNAATTAEKEHAKEQ